MNPRDWTPSDQADAADAQCDRDWWRRDPHAEPDYRADEADDPMTPNPHPQEADARRKP